MTVVADEIRLTRFSHGGGCGCKIAPALLAELLATTPVGGLPAALLVGSETADDAAVYRLNDAQALVATTDFFTPIVDDPCDFGRIAATNAISDVYAMGAQPIFALAVVGMPLATLPVAAIQKILEGGASVCAAAGIPVAGGHSIDTLEPIYGLVALGLVHPDRVKRNSAAQAGDLLVLGKPLGIGILSAALKQGKLSQAGYAQMIEWTTRLNTPGIALAEMPGVHALTDVTGFGLAGHLLEICRGSKLGAENRFRGVAGDRRSARVGEGGRRDRALPSATGTSYGRDVELPADSPAWVRALVTDPQTSGGLLAACAPEDAPRVLAEFRARGFEVARVIGHLAEGPARIRVRGSG